MQKPSIPKGTRDFSPSEMVKRDYIFNVIKGVFINYGYSPIETPAMENLSTLLGKYGEEGDRLLFKILNSGDFLSKTDPAKIQEKDTNAFAMEISEKGLRYDLTVPFARYVVQNRNDITFPFKRYQIQPVWRADRPQRGRYREFYQCDADVVGSNSLLNEIELLQIIEEVFSLLKIKVTVKINNRKILAGIAEVIGTPESVADIATAMDKIEKIGKDGFVEELTSREIPKESIDELCSYIFSSKQSLVTTDYTNEDKIKFLKSWLLDSETGKKGIEELIIILSILSTTNPSLNIELDLRLARGLNYYTGAIIEVRSDDVPIGSICGGGRYDDLTGIFGLKDVSGVGISFGADRIYDVMEQMKVFPSEVTASVRILIVNFGEKEQNQCLEMLKKIRKAGIPGEYYPDAVKLKKQMTYANLKKIPYVLLAGEEEIKSQQYTLKNMITGIQEKLTVAEIIEKLRQ
ncbi:MAG: histidine--tRNA ligase [Bacteroidales bacterium]|nr:histidine--tRNA ligase [Bacteroidales bacterium]